METLLDDIFYEGPQVYTRGQLSDESELFRSRTALFYTPTENIPCQFVGSGTLDIRLPIAFPTSYEWQEILAYRIPRPMG